MKGEKTREGGRGEGARERGKNQGMRRFSTHSRICSMSSRKVLGVKYFTADKCVCARTGSGGAGGGTWMRELMKCSRSVCQCGSAGNMLCNLLSGGGKRDQGQNKEREEEERKNVTSEGKKGESLLLVSFCLSEVCLSMCNFQKPSFYNLPYSHINLISFSLCFLYKQPKVYYFHTSINPCPSPLLSVCHINKLLSFLLLNFSSGLGCGSFLPKVTSL